MTACSQKTTTGGEAVGREIESAVDRGLLERGKVGLLDLKPADEEEVVLDAGGLKKVTKLKMVDVDASRDDVWMGIDVLYLARHGG